jgi:hypothetical protein
MLDKGASLQEMLIKTRIDEYIKYAQNVVKQRV